MADTTIGYITLAEALEARPNSHAISTSDRSWLEILNSLPLFPSSFHLAAQALGNAVLAMLPGVSEIVFHADAEHRVGPSSPQGTGLTAPRGQHPTRRYSVRHKTQTVQELVTESANATSVSIPIPDDHGGQLAVLEVRTETEFATVTLRVLPSVVALIGFVLTDLEARCTVFWNRSVMSLNDLTAHIVRDLRLTARDHSVLQLIMSGASYIEAADELALSVETVKKHMKKIYDRTRADGLAGLFAKYASLGNG